MEYLVVLLSVAAIFVEMPAPASSACTMADSMECMSLMPATGTGSSGPEGTGGSPGSTGDDVSQIFQMAMQNCQKMNGVKTCLETKMKNCGSEDDTIKMAMEQMLLSVKNATESCDSCDLSALGDCLKSGMALLQSFMGENPSFSKADCGKLNSFISCVENVQCNDPKMVGSFQQQLIEGKKYMSMYCPTETSASASSSCTLLDTMECQKIMQGIAYSNSPGSEGKAGSEGQSMQQVIVMCQKMNEINTCYDTKLKNCGSGDDAAKNSLQKAKDELQENVDNCKSCDWSGMNKCVESNEKFMESVELLNETVSVSKEDCGKMIGFKTCVTNVQCSNPQIDYQTAKGLAATDELIKKHCATDPDGANVVRSSSIPVVLVLLSALLKLLF